MEKRQYKNKRAWNRTRCMSCFFLATLLGNGCGQPTEEKFPATSSEVEVKDKNTTQETKHVAPANRNRGVDIATKIQQEKNKAAQHRTEKEKYIAETAQHRAEKEKYIAETAQHIAEKEKHRTEKEKHIAETAQHRAEKEKYIAETAQHRTEKEKHRTEKEKAYERIAELEAQLAAMDQEPLETVPAQSAYAQHHSGNQEVQRGILEEKYAIVRNLLANGNYSIEFISKATGISKKEVEAIQQNMATAAEAVEIRQIAK
ncbi:MAG: hypothetical protein ACX93T_03400 [Bacteroidota bacterium]